MKSKASGKAVVTAHEKARILKDNAVQLGQAASAAKNEVRRAKGNLKLAKQEVKLTRKAAKEAKRAYAEARCAAEEAASELAALGKRAPDAREKSPRGRAKPGKSNPARARKRVSRTTKRRAAAPRSAAMKAPSDKAISRIPVSLPGSMPVQSDTEAPDVALQVTGDILPVSSSVAPGDTAHVPADVFAGGPPHNGPSTLPGADTTK